MSVLPELFNLRSGFEGRTWVLGFHQVRSSLELMAQDLELELDIMHIPIYLFISFSLYSQFPNYIIYMYFKVILLTNEKFFLF